MVLAGDPKQAPPIGDDPLYRDGAYTGRGKNLPPRQQEAPTNAWSMAKFHTVGNGLLREFEDVVRLRKVHRYAEERENVAAEDREEFQRDARRFLDVTRGMADCTWKPEDHQWLSRRNKTRLAQTVKGREQLKRFRDAPLLMDGRVDKVTGEVGANKMNQMELERLSARTQKPIVVLSAFYDKPALQSVF